MRADARANRTAIIDAARRLYTAKGPDVPFSAVAQEAGVGAGTLYRHFPTERDLVIGIAQTLQGEIRDACHRWQEPMATRAEESWPRFVDELVDMRVAAYMPRLVEGIDASDLVPTLAEIRRGALADLEEVLEHARSAGLLEPSVTAEQFQMGLAVATRPLPAAAAALVPDIDEWIVEVYLRGVRPHAG